MNNETIRQEVQALHDYTIAMRRTMHSLAEIANEEFDTRAAIEKELKEDGIPFTELQGTSLYAEIDAGRPGPFIALRTDMDALPMPESENNLKQKRVVRSRTPDRTCHACGHDAHMAMCLAACKALAKHKEELTGKIGIIFESGEECGAGYPIVAEYLKDYRFDAVWSIHVYAGIPSGKLCVHEGPRMAGGNIVDITFHGRGGHGSRPDQAVNPVFCAASYLNNLAVAFANQIDANQTVTLGITGIIGGTVSNVIPDDARVIGSFRFFDTKEGEKACRIKKEVAEHTAAMYHCTVEYGPMSDLVGVPVINNPDLARLAEQGIAELAPEAVTDWEPWYASESYARYLQKWPGVQCQLGIRNDAKGTGAPHHNTCFDVDEDVLDLGVLATLKYVAAVQEHYGR